MIWAAWPSGRRYYYHLPKSTSLKTGPITNEIRSGLTFVAAVSAASARLRLVSFGHYRQAVEESLILHTGNSPAERHQARRCFCNPSCSSDGNRSFSGVFPIEQLFRLTASSERGSHLLIEDNPEPGRLLFLRYLAGHAFERPDRLGLNERRIPMMVRLHSLAKVSGMSIEVNFWLP